VREKRKKKMGNTKNNKKNSKSERLDAVEKAYAEDRLSHSQYTDLLADESSVEGAERFKKFAGATLLAVVAFVLIWGSL
jgi:hypothetical protein